MTIYIAGPYTGDVEENVAAAIFAGQSLVEYGFVPFVPHLYHFWDQQHPNPYETWMKLCLMWVTKCDALLRLPGNSPGADREVALAKATGVLVFYSIDDVIKAHTLGAEPWP